MPKFKVTITKVPVNSGAVTNYGEVDAENENKAARDCYNKWRTDNPKEWGHIEVICPAGWWCATFTTTGVW